MPLHCLFECQCPWSCRLCSNLALTQTLMAAYCCWEIHITMAGCKKSGVSKLGTLPWQKNPSFHESKQNLEISMKIISWFCFILMHCLSFNSISLFSLHSFMKILPFLKWFNWNLKISFHEINEMRNQEMKWNEQIAKEIKCHKMKLKKYILAYWMLDEKTPKGLSLDSLPHF